jgi:hypothetical protein
MRSSQTSSESNDRSNERMCKVLHHTTDKGDEGSKIRSIGVARHANTPVEQMFEPSASTV